MSFKISDLVEKTDSFSFEYDGFTLSGRYYKYKTQTPKYAKAAIAASKAQTNGDNGDQALASAGSQWLADTLLEWNAVNDDGTPLPITPQVFDLLPAPFIQQFGEYLNGLLSPKKESTASPDI